MSTVIAKNVQIGTSGTATDNFTIFQPATPDGTLRIGNGNTGITSSFVSMTSAGDVAVSGAFSVAGNNISAVNSLGFRNRIINGDMRIDQRNAGASVNSASGTNVFAVDRFGFDQSAECVIACQRVADAPTGFVNSLRMTVSTPDSSVGAAQYAQLQQKFEGFNVADLAWGTASAASVTLSFWVKSSVTGNYPVRLVNADGSRSYPFYVTVNAANTWEYKTKTIPGPTSGTFSTDNSTSFALGFSFAVGSNYTGATADVWNTTSGYLAANLANTTGWVATTGATFNITGVQLEAGSVASPFERRDYGRELIMCQRYYQRYQATSAYTPVLFQGRMRTTTSFAGVITLPVVMRAAPTVTATNSTNAWYIATAGDLNSNTVTLDNASTSVVALTMTTSTGVAGQGGTVYPVASGTYFDFNSEL